MIHIGDSSFHCKFIFKGKLDLACCHLCQLYYLIGSSPLFVLKCQARIRFVHVFSYRHCCDPSQELLISWFDLLDSSFLIRRPLSPPLGGAEQATRLLGNARLLPLRGRRPGCNVSVCLPLAGPGYPFRARLLGRVFIAYVRTTASARNAQRDNASRFHRRR